VSRIKYQTINKKANLTDDLEADLTDDLTVLNELVKLANIQEERVLAMRAQERKSGFINPRLDTAIRVHQDLLVSLQAMRFDLGLDEYQRRTPREQIAAAAEKEERLQRQVYEACEHAEEIFRQRLPGTRDVTDVANPLYTIPKPK
jgi:hypothetical protein